MRVSPTTMVSPSMTRTAVSGPLAPSEGWSRTEPPIEMKHRKRERH
jgi:hypothetical protein